MLNFCELPIYLHKNGDRKELWHLRSFEDCQALCKEKDKSARLVSLCPASSTNRWLNWRREIKCALMSSTWFIHQNEKRTSSRHSRVEFSWNFDGGFNRSLLKFVYLSCQSMALCCKYVFTVSIPGLEEANTSKWWILSRRAYILFQRGK